MYFIGITGGVGAGKSEVLGVLEALPRTVVLRADDLARELVASDKRIHKQIAKSLPDYAIFDATGKLDREVLSKIIFSDEKKRNEINSIIHPAVKAEILARVEGAKKSGKIDFYFLEAALLFEERYDRLCDEIWYIYASKDTRRKRLEASRGYSKEKIEAIMDSQLKEEEFRRLCQRIIDNDGRRRTAREQVLDCVAKLQAK